MPVEAAVERQSKELFRVAEFAKLAGVTVRALHHYDRLGLLRPKQRSEAGYRLYSACDFGRLEQIVVLKFLGVPLKQVRGLLEHESNLAKTLERQQAVLGEKRRQVEKAIRAIGNALRSVRNRKEPDWKLFQLIVREIEMQNRMEWKGKYFSEEAKARVRERLKTVTAEEHERANVEWAALYQEAEKCLGENPSGAKAQKLADRWCELVEGFTGGDREVLKGLQAMWADSKNWPLEMQKGPFANAEVRELLEKAVLAKKRKSSAVLVMTGG